MCLLVSFYISSPLSCGVFTNIYIVLIFLLFISQYSVLHAQGRVADAYKTCSSILTQLGDTVPESIDPELVKAMVPETLKEYNEIYGDEWLGRKVEDSKVHSIVGLYTQMTTCAFLFKAPHIVAYFVCKGVQISLRNGVCEHTPLAFIHLSNVLTRSGKHTACVQ